MNNTTAGRAHWSFWVIGAVALIWNVLGAVNFIMQMNADAVAAMPETHRAIIEGRPAWATAAFALAVFSGAIGCLLLLLRKSGAYNLFIASLLGVFVQMVPNLGMTGLAIHFDPFDIFIMILIPLVVAVFLIWYARRAQSKGWIC